MSFQKIVLVYYFVFFNCFFLNGAENLPKDPVCFLQLLSPDKAELLQTLQQHANEIAEDFRKKGYLYKVWHNNKDTKSLHFSFNGHEYNLQDTMRLFHGILDGVESPILLSNIFASLYVNNTDHDAHFKNDFYNLHSTLNSFKIICLVIDENEFTSMIMSESLFIDKICIYDAISYLSYIGCVIDLISWIEKIEPEPFSCVNKKIIIDLLNKISADIDAAFNTYIVSERAIVAHVASSLLKNEADYNEAQETIRYLNSLIGKTEIDQQNFLKEYEEHMKISRTSKSEVELSEISQNFIQVRRLMPDFLKVNKSLKLRISKLRINCPTFSLSSECP